MNQTEYQEISGYELDQASQEVIGAIEIPMTDLADMDATGQLKLMREWFLANYEDPAHSLPYESREGGYIWIEAYEASIIGFVNWLTMNPSARLVRKNLARYAQSIDKAALNKSLSQVVLQFATPGVPDIYQGQEARDFGFVDPDNRSSPVCSQARNTISPAALASSTTSWCRKAMPKSPQMLASPYPPIDFFPARRNGKS